MRPHNSDYRLWKALWHHFYDPFPTVEHFERVLPATIELDSGE